METPQRFLKNVTKVHFFIRIHIKISVKIGCAEPDWPRDRRAWRFSKRYGIFQKTL